MKQSNQQIKLKHNAIDLYKIVLDIERYPDYIPWCSSIEILKREKNEIKANMFVDYKFFPSQKFTSNVYYDFENLQIKTKYIDGPLKDLNTLWKFIEIEKNKSKVFFTLNFEFKNFFHQKFSELFFPLVKNRMIESFVRRADQILN